MKTIHKFIVPFDGVIKPINKFANLLDVQQQGDDIVAWFEVDTDQPLVEKFNIHIYPTGCDIPDVVPPQVYVTTIQDSDNLVWHIYRDGDWEFIRAVTG